MSNDAGVAQPGEFSLVLGGPFYQLLLRVGLLRPPLERLKRRLLVIALFAWLPLLVFAAIEGHAFGDAIRVPFLRDIEVHARLLVALPLLIFAERVVHMRLGRTVEQFLRRGIVGPGDRSRFEGILASTMQLSNLVVIEVVLFLFVLTVGHYLWREHLSLMSDTWYARIETGARHLTLAGMWLAFVTVPLFQFILMRWYFRLFLWARALWLMSRLDLRLVPTHPDRSGGIGFLGTSAYAFSTLLFAQGVLLSGLIATRIFYNGQTLTAFKLEIFGFVLLMVLVVVGPLFVFTPRLLAAKRQGLGEYGLLANQYVHEFEQKWIGGNRPSAEPLVGSGDIQSLADLASSFGVVRGMRFVPFGKETLLKLAVVTALPVSPLLLTMIPLEEIVTKLLGVLL